ncbi:DNA polymerase V [Smittium mucronatum]|uniref:DNA polymerase V n=1 Tax=Smittium mucronatum TaxID=133383 RepID=A0A1R0GMV7_9FUNG|nr:DNA polymerase V [Smittium mucronatum]
MSSTLEYYWDLADLNPEKRIKAARQLLHALINFQKAFELQASANNSDDAPNPLPKEAKKESDLELLCAPDVGYALKRLIKGLTSSRDAARQGFSMVLSELLAQTPVITTQLVLSILFKVSEIKSSMTGQEQKDMWFGRLFTFLSLATSGVLSKSTTTNEDLSKIVDQLVEMSNIKPWLREASYNTLCRIVQSVDSEVLSSFLIPYIMDNVVGGDDIDSPDKLKLVLLLIKLCPEYPWSSTLKSWDSGSIYSYKNLNKLAKILSENSADSPDSSVYHHPSVHSVWHEIIDDYFPTNSEIKSPALNVSSDSSPLSFMDIWDAVVDKSYFSPNSSITRKFWGFQLAEIAIVKVSPDTVPMLLTKNLFYTLMNMSRIKKSNLHNVSKNLLQSLTTRAESDKIISLALVEKLTGPGSVRNFDKVTRSNTVSNLMANLTPESLISYVNHLEFLVLNPNKLSLESQSTNDSASSSPETVRKNRIWALDQIMKILNNAELPRSKKLFDNSIQFFVTNSLSFAVDKSSETQPLLDLEIIKALSERLISLFGILTKLPMGFEKLKDFKVGDKELRLLGSTSDGDLWISKILNEISSVENSCLKKSKSSPQMTLLYSQSKPEIKKRKEIVQRINLLLNPKAVRGSTGDEHDLNKKSRSIGELLCLLYIQSLVTESITSDLLKTGEDVDESLFSLQNEDLPELAKSIDELMVCADHIFNKKKASEQETHIPEEVLLDLLVSLLTRKNSVLRNVINSVFSVISSNISTTGLDILFDTIKSQNQNVQILEDSEDELDEIIENDSSKTKDDGFLEVDSLLEDRLKSALGDHLANNNDEGDDNEMEDDDSSDEELLNDEQMEEFDEKLSAIFKIKNQEKKEKAEGEQSVIDFKLRVLDLYSLYIKKQSKSGNPLIFKVISQLIPLAHRFTISTKNANLYSKIRTCVLSLKRPDIEVFINGDDESQIKQLVESAISSLQTVFSTAKKSNEKTELETYTFACTFISKILASLSSKLGASSNPKLVEQGTNARLGLEKIYFDAAKDFFERKNSKLQYSFFSPLITQFKTESSSFLPFNVAEIISRYSDPSAVANGFRLAEAYQYYGDLVKCNISEFKKHLNEGNEGIMRVDDWLVKLSENLVKCVDVYNSSIGTKSPSTEEEKSANGTKSVAIPQQRLVSILKSFYLVLKGLKHSLPPNTDLLEYKKSSETGAGFNKASAVTNGIQVPDLAPIYQSIKSLIENTKAQAGKWI